MKLLVFYLSGYVIAAVWTAVWVLREKVEESKALRICFAAVTGILSWALVVLYLITWSENRRRERKQQSDD